MRDINLGCTWALALMPSVATWLFRFDARSDQEHSEAGRLVSARSASMLLGYNLGALRTL